LGLLDRERKWLIEPRFTAAAPFSEDKAWVSDGEKKSCIDRGR
jgi:hypothetical protein